MKIELKELEALTTQALKNYGYDDAETATIREMLLYAQLRGNNQGVVKLIGKGIPKDPNAGAITIEKETALSAKINGHQNQAMVAVKKALEVVLEKARAQRHRHRRYFQHFYVIRCDRLCRLRDRQPGPRGAGLCQFAAAGGHRRILPADLRHQSFGRGHSRETRPDRSGHVHGRHGLLRARRSPNGR